MAYKARYRPSEILVGGSWRPLTDNDLGADFSRPAVNAMVRETAG